MCFMEFVCVCLLRSGGFRMAYLERQVWPPLVLISRPPAPRRVRTPPPRGLCAGVSEGVSQGLLWLTCPPTSILTRMGPSPSPHPFVSRIQSGAGTRERLSCELTPGLCQPLTSPEHEGLWVTLGCFKSLRPLLPEAAQGMSGPRQPLCYLQPALDPKAGERQAPCACVVWGRGRPR